MHSDPSWVLKSRRVQGFTLVEIIIVIVILGVIATIAIPRITAQIEVSRATEAVQFMGTLRRAVQQCIDTSATNCDTKEDLGVSIGASSQFVYTMSREPGWVHFKGIRNVNGTDLAICLDLAVNGQGDISVVLFGTAPAGNPYEAVVNKVNATSQLTGGMMGISCDTNPLANALNNP